MQKKYDVIMQEIDCQMANIDLNKNNIISDCRGMILILKEKLAEMKAFLLAHPFHSEADEITSSNIRNPLCWGDSSISTRSYASKLNVHLIRKS